MIYHDYPDCGKLKPFDSYYAGIDLDRVAEVEEDAGMSVKDQLLSQVARVLGLKKKHVEVKESKPQNASKCICVPIDLPVYGIIQQG